MKPTLTVIDGTPPPDTPQQRRLSRIRKATPEILVRCKRCEGNAMMTVTLGMTWSATGKPTGGTRQVVCAMCLSRGEYVPV